MSASITSQIVDHMNAIAALQRQAAAQVPDSERFSLFPIRDTQAWRFYQDQLGSFWVPQEVNLREDTRDLEKLTEDEYNYLVAIHAFFASADGVVAENLIQRFLLDCQTVEEKFFYGVQLAIEQVHAETYNRIIELLVSDPDKRNEVFKAIDTNPAVAKKAAWMQKYIYSDLPRIYRLFAFACAEWIFFSGSFCSIFWFKSRGMFPGISEANRIISRDEGLHCEFAAMLFKRLMSQGVELDVNVVLSILEEAMDVEREFIAYLLPKSIREMSSEKMTEYIEYMADRLLVSCGLNKKYMTKNPFPWMDMISLTEKPNMHERNGQEYSRFSKKEAEDGHDDDTPLDEIDF